MIGFHYDQRFAFEDRDLPADYANFIWDQLREVQLALSEVVPNTFLNMNHRSIETGLYPGLEMSQFLNLESEKVLLAWASLKKKNHPPLLKWVEDRFSRYLQAHFTEELQESSQDLLIASSLWTQSFWVSLLNLQGKTLHRSSDQWIFILSFEPTDLDMALLKSLMKTVDVEFRLTLDHESVEDENASPTLLTFDRKHE